MRAVPLLPLCTIPGSYRRWALIDRNPESAAEQGVRLQSTKGSLVRKGEEQARCTSAPEGGEVECV